MLPLMATEAAKPLASDFSGSSSIQVSPLRENRKTEPGPEGGCSGKEV
jgi:hypothetical protein